MRTYDVPTRLAFVIPEEVEAPQVFLMQLPDGQPVVLRGTSAVIWMLAADGEPDVVAAVLGVVTGERDQVSGEVQLFLSDLVDRGLLEHVSD